MHKIYLVKAYCEMYKFPYVRGLTMPQMKIRFSNQEYFLEWGLPRLVMKVMLR